MIPQIEIRFPTRVRAAVRKERQIFKNVATRQLVSQIGEVRRATDKELIPILKPMQSATDSAKEMGERQWDEHSVLRRAKSGNGSAQGILEATQLRAAYAAVLEVRGPVESTKWAQQAIDSGVPILCDSVRREAGACKRDEQPFSCASLLAKIHNADQDQARAFLTRVIDLAQQGGLAHSEFQRQVPDAFQLLAPE